MAIATQPKLDQPSDEPLLIRVSTSVYRFMASVKLAVLSIACLAAVLAYATFFESWYGVAAVQEWIYRSPGFAVLLAFLGMNILCAALIRYPWKKRQTGFVITHAGLLTVLAGSLITFRFADEGQVSLAEGGDASQLVRTDYPAIRVQELDRETGRASSEYTIPFRPTTFDWLPGQARPKGVFSTFLSNVTLGALDGSPGAGEILTPPKAPFQLVIKGNLPASIGVYKHEKDASGDPMIKASLLVKPPGALSANDILEDPSDQWLVARDRAFRRVVENARPVQFVFQYASEPEMIQDFLELPGKSKGPNGVARLRYKDNQEKERVFDWPFDDPSLKAPLTLPDSDLTVNSAEVKTIPSSLSIEGATIDLTSKVGDRTVELAIFKIKKGSAPEVNQFAFSMLPVASEVLERQASGGVSEQLAKVSYYHAPKLNEATKRGFVEVMGTPDGKLFYRAITLSGLKGPAPLTLGEEAQVLGGDKSPMKGTLIVQKYLSKGKESLTFEPIRLPKGQMGSGIPAALVEMTVGGEKKEFWVRRGRDLDPHYQFVHFADRDYQIAYDFDRRDMGFEVKLVNFEVGFDPGTEQAKSYLSEVLLNDPSQGLKNQPVTITMNKPMVHRSWTFYQSGFDPIKDPETNRETGEFKSILQVGYDPGRVFKYAGCGMVVLGAFVQFYMRAAFSPTAAKGKKRRKRPRRAKPSSPKPRTRAADR